MWISSDVLYHTQTASASPGSRGQTVRTPRSVRLALRSLGEGGFHKTDTFRGGALLAVNLGDDADTTGAVYGQLAGAYYGASGIPKEWLDKLAMREEIGRMAERLYQMSGR